MKSIFELYVPGPGSWIAY